MPAIAIACSDAQTQQWLPLPRPYTEDAARSYALEVAPAALASGRALERAIELNGEFAGVIGLKNTDWALDSQGIERVEVLVATGNAASLATARKAKFIEEGTLRRAGYTHDGKVDLVILSRLAHDPRPRL